MDVSDGDLVRLARAGEPAAFRILVERYLPLARARASRCADPGDVDDIVQESFLQALVALDRLRDPDRFGGWLGGIVLNVHRAWRRRAPLSLLADWPERLHPASRDGLPSADDLDRSQVARQAVAELPAGQRRAVAMFYYADSRPARSPGRRPRPRPACTRPGAGCASTSPHTVPTSSPPGHGERPWSLFASRTPSPGPGG